MKNRSELINFNYLAQGKLSEDEMPTYVADSSSDSEIWDLPMATVVHLQPNSEGIKK
jgi:hypothetical protein